jgi:3-oxoacyl-[acyl-carrier protein] reductase
MAEWRRLDILVNNAGKGAPHLPVEEVSSEEWDRTMTINLKSTFLSVRSVAPIMKRQNY